MAQDTTVNAETLTVIAGPIKALAGSVSLDAGSLTTDGSGNLTAKKLTVTQIAGGVAVTTFAASNTNTLVTSGVRVIRCATSGVSTSISNILATGNVNGQELTIINENTTAGSSIDFAGGSATSNVLGTGTAINGNAAARFIWDAGLTFWVRCL